MLSGAEIWPHSKWNLGDFFPILKKNHHLQKNNLFFFEDWDFYSVNTHIRMLHGDILLQFNGNSMCNS